MGREESSRGPMNLRVYPDAILRRRAERVAVDRFEERLAGLASRMTRMMYEEEGVGLAAPQVGVSLRLIVVDPSQERDSPLVLVNPRVVDARGRDVGEEGCLSVPGVRAKVRRRDRVTVEYETATGERQGADADGLLARIFQHEIDHLDGTLFIDRLGSAGRLAVRHAVRNLEARALTRSSRRKMGLTRCGRTS